MLTRDTFLRVPICVYTQMAIQTAEVQEKARACCTNPKLLITYLWFITLVRSFVHCRVMPRLHFL